MGHFQTRRTRILYRLDDRRVDADRDQKRTVTKIEDFSEAYFKLVHDHPELVLQR